MIDKELILNIVKSSSHFNYTPNESGIIEDLGLQKYIKESVDSIFRESEDSIVEMINNRKRYSELKISHELYISNGLFFLSLLQSIYHYLIGEIKGNSYYEKCSTALFNHIFNLYQSILDLLISGQNLIAVSLARMIYEAYSILNYITKYPELSEPYYDHSICAINKLNKIEFILNDNNYQEEVQRIIKKYEESFLDDYGWTMNRISIKRNRKLSTIAKELETDGYNSFYRLSSDVIHSSSFYINNSFEDILRPDDIIALSTEMVSNGTMVFMKGIKLDNNIIILLRNIIYSLREELLGEPSENPNE